MGLTIERLDCLRWGSGRRLYNLDSPTDVGKDLRFGLKDGDIVRMGKEGSTRSCEAEGSEGSSENEGFFG